MMLDWNDYRKQLAAGLKEIGQLSPDTIKGYMALSAAGQKTDLLGAKSTSSSRSRWPYPCVATGASRCIPRPQSNTARPGKILPKLWESPPPSTPGLRL